MKEGGLIDNWIKKRTPKNLQCKGLRPQTTAKVVTIGDFQGAIYVLVGGTVLAGLILIIEYFMKRGQINGKPLEQQEDKVSKKINTIAFS